MSEMSSLFWKGFAKLICIFLPATAAIFVAIYFAEIALLHQGLRQFAFVAAVVGFIPLTWLFNWLLAPLLSEMKAIRQGRRS